MGFIDKKLEKEGFKRMNPRSYNISYVKWIKNEKGYYRGHFVELNRYEDSDGKSKLYIGSYLHGGTSEVRMYYEPLTFKQMALFFAKMIWLNLVWMTESVIPKRKRR